MRSVLTILYSLSALYFLYMAALGIFVYFANKSMGHYETFLVPGRNLAAGTILGVFAFVGWKWMKDPETYKAWALWLYLPAGCLLLFALWFLLLYISSGGRWN